LVGLAGRASAGSLDPNAFPSLGASPTAVGAYTFNTSADVSPTLAGPGGTINGVYFADVPGHTIAVFDFDSIAIGSGMTFTGSGANVLALLSRGDVTLSGTGRIDVSGFGGGFGPPGEGGPGGGGGGDGQFYRPGIGNGPGGGSGSGGGGGFGGSGGSGSTIGAGGSISYGNLAALLQGGSGGGSGGINSGAGGAGGGAGGGGLEIGAVGNLSIGGAGILTNGGDGGFGLGGGGGGSGGGLLLHADSVTLTSLLSAQGGSGAHGSFLGGGGGGGGRMLIQTGNGGFSNSGTIDVLGGGPGSDGFGRVGRPGAVGVVTINVVPEPASIVILGTGVLGLVCYGWWKAR
jgi:hypothetical protein